MMPRNDRSTSPNHRNDWSRKVLPGAVVEDLSGSMPLSLAGIFDEAFDVYKRFFGPIALVVALGVIPVEMLQHGVYTAWLGPLNAKIDGLAAPDPALLLESWFGSCLFGSPHGLFPGLLWMFVILLISAPVAVVVSDVYFGRAPSAAGSWRRSVPYLGRMLGGYTVAAFALFAAGILLAGCLAALDILVGLFFGLIPGIGPYPEIIWSILSAIAAFIACLLVVGKHLLMLTPLSVLEGLGPVPAFTRNAQLVGKNRLVRTGAAVMFLPIVTWGMEAFVQYATGSTLEAVHLPGVVQFIVETALGTGVSFLFTPYWMIAVTLIYYDYRVRREGFDVRVLSMARTLPALDNMGDISASALRASASDRALSAADRTNI